MKRVYLLPIVFLLGCEGVGSAYNTLPIATKTALLALAAAAFALTTKFVVQKKVYFAQAE